jgi:diguanylate cyclase (GGDEF)-like protein
MAARPLKVLLAIEDRPTLRHCARLLTGFGHKVSSASTMPLADDRLRADRPDMLVVAGASREAALALGRAASADPTLPAVFKVLLLSDPTTADLISALEAGFDDFLTAPVDAAELLVRLRTAARVLEFERRLGRLAQREQPSGLLNRQAFLLAVQGELAASESNGPLAIACIVLQPDAYAELRELHGLPLAQQAVQELVTLIQTGQTQLCCGRLDGQRLALALPGTVEEALARAEQLRSAVADAGFRVREIAVPWTISLGVSFSGKEATSSAALLEQAEKALVLAQQSGGNQVAKHDDVVAEEQRWSELAGGRLFADTLLRNIMVPCPRLLRTTDSLPQAKTLLAQTRLPALPVVDEEGKLAGLLSATRPLRVTADSNAGTVAEALQKEAVSFDEATTLPALLDYFAQESPPVVVVVHKGRPTGLVTPETLATLVEPLSTASFAVGREGAGHVGLIVPNLCTAE